MMSEMLAEELQSYSEELAVEDEMRSILQQVGANGLGKVLFGQDVRHLPPPALDHPQADHHPSSHRDPCGDETGPGDA